MFLLKWNLYFKRYTRTLSIFNFGKSTGDFHMIAMFRQQYKTVMLKCCCSFIKSCSKHFCIYCYLPVTCFCICSSPCIKLHIFCIGLHICPYLLVIIHITFPSLQSFALQYSFGTIIRFLSSFSFTHFSCSLFCQQPFLIFILYNIRC